MRRFVMCAAAMMVVWLGVVGVGSDEDRDARGLRGGDEVECPVIWSHEQGHCARALSRMPRRSWRRFVETSWRSRVSGSEKKQDAAVGIVKDGLTKIDALDKMLSATPVDQMAAQAAAKEVQGTCGACHKQYREGDAQTGFKFKAGVI